MIYKKIYKPEHIRTNERTYIYLHMNGMSFLHVGNMKEYHITPLTDAQVINQPWIWYSDNILPIKMSVINKYKRETQTTDWSVIICSYSSDGLYEAPVYYPVHVGYSNFRYTDKHHSYNTSDCQCKLILKVQKKKRGRKEKRYVIYCYFKDGPTQRKQMMEFEERNLPSLMQVKDIQTKQEWF